MHHARTRMFLKCLPKRCDRTHDLTLSFSRFVILSAAKDLLNGSGKVQTDSRSNVNTLLLYSIDMQPLEEGARQRRRIDVRRSRTPRKGQHCTMVRAKWGESNPPRSPRQRLNSCSEESIFPKNYNKYRKP